MTVTGRAPETLPRAPHWSDRAACSGLVSLFIPAGIETERPTAASRAREADALRVCRRCPVAAPCLADALRTEKGAGEHGRAGVRGGLTPAERAAQVRRKRRGGAEPLTLLDIYLAKTEPCDDGHVRWTGRKPQVTFKQRVYSSRQLAWATATLREPEGQVLATCGRPECVAAEHLSDAVMRWHAERRAAA